MKKTILTSVLFIIVVLCGLTQSFATTGAELPQKIYEKGAKYGVTQGHKVKMERYIAKHPITDEQADQVLAKVDEEVKILEKAGVTRVGQLSSADLKKVQEIATEAAAIVGVKIVWRGATVDVYYNGKIEETIDFSANMPNTGNEVNIALVVSLVAVVALATGFVARKKFANA